MNLKELYETNEDFKSYVDRYLRTSNITLEDALHLAVIREYAIYLRNRLN